eukprot:COSAG01_NODE_1279_length_10929_cov_4.549492_8_plen_64_part_00
MAVAVVAVSHGDNHSTELRRDVNALRVGTAVREDIRRHLRERAARACMHHAASVQRVATPTYT